ncbi:Crp/Fnr family transcriptional regulator [Primorskyibacter sp. S87]|uniref:Crp/Fnr family transcriptional regulator n=1 Tax=Primorskyibacter sp. S87 TaxID=3415126 RepID=UPI003C7D6A5F
MAGLSVLTSQGWLSERPLAFQKKVLDALSIRDFEVGKTLYRYGDPADGLYGILSGSVRIATPGDDEQEMIAHYDQAGFWVGDLAVLSGLERLVTVEATEPCRAAFLSRTHILDMVHQEPDWYREFYALTHANMQTLLRIVANLSASGSDRRVALRLLQLDDTRRETGGWIPVTQASLSELVGLSLPTLQRSLRRLVSSDVIEVGYGKLRVTDRVALRSDAQS